MRYTHLIFDADGTLWDFQSAQNQALHGLFNHLNIGWDERYRKVYKEVNNAIWTELEEGRIAPAELSQERFRRYFQQLDIKFDPAEASNLFLEELSRGRDLIEGAEDVLEDLKRAGCRMVLCTNGLKKVQRPRHNNSPIKRFFDDIVISEELGIAKPHRRIFEVAMEKLGRPDKKEVLMIGDNPASDIKGGNEFGIDTCLFLENGKEAPADVEATHIIGHLRELRKIVI